MKVMISKYFYTYFIKFEALLGKLLSACLWIMVASLVIGVVCRYFLSIGATALNDLALYMQASIVLLGLSITLKHDRHVRLDILYSRSSNTQKRWVNLFGNLIFLFPFSLFLIFACFDYVNRSWILLEESSEAGGLGGIYIIKSFLILGPALVSIRSLTDITQLLVSLPKKDE